MNQKKERRHMLAVTNDDFEKLLEFKEQLENKLRLKLTMSQIIVYLINHHKDTHK